MSRILKLHGGGECNAPAIVHNTESISRRQFRHRRYVICSTALSSYGSLIRISSKRKSCHKRYIYAFLGGKWTSLQRRKSRTKASLIQRCTWIKGRASLIQKLSSNVRSVISGISDVRNDDWDFALKQGVTVNELPGDWLMFCFSEQWTRGIGRNNVEANAHDSGNHDAWVNENHMNSDTTGTGGNFELGKVLPQVFISSTSDHAMDDNIKHCTGDEVIGDLNTSLISKEENLELSSSIALVEANAVETAHEDSPLLSHDITAINQSSHDTREFERQSRSIRNDDSNLTSSDNWKHQSDTLPSKLLQNIDFENCFRSFSCIQDIF